MNKPNHICKYKPSEVINIGVTPKCIFCGKPLPNPPLNAMDIKYGAKYTTI